MADVDQNVAEIVARLSSQMRCAVTWPSSVGGRVRIIPRTLYSATIRALENRSLIDDQYWLTDLGLAVRNHLIATDKGGGDTGDLPAAASTKGTTHG